MMLADQGADVIKVESPHGDLMRHFSRGRNGMNAAFLSCNRNKRSLAVDLKSADGLEIIKKLIATAQVLVHNFRPGIAERIGLPRMVRTIIADYTTALTAAQAITAALFARERTGEGQHVRLSMLDSMISYLWPEAMPSLTFVGAETDPSDGEVGPDLVFATQDRYITAAALSDDEWAGMCRALNREELIDDPRFKTARDRSINAVERRTITSTELEKWRADEILPRLLANDVPSAPVVSRFKLLQDVQVRENHILEEFESEKFGRVRMPRPAAQFDRTPATVRALAPMLGADNAAILAELGYQAADIARLESGRVVHNQSKKESVGG
jgi:crotonobetainyl-CoA:carnitine CoA-transferase CaiB-like acyl-CoA transferase